MTSQLIALLASAGLVGAGVASAAGTRAFDALPVVAAAGAAADNLCRVDVVRSGAPGSAAVTRSEINNTCICTITTGPSGNNGSAENIVNALLRDRTCDGAPPPAGEVGEAAAGAAGGGASGVLIAVGAIGVGGGLAAAMGSDSSG